MDKEFKAEKDEHGNLTVKAIIEKKGNDVIVHVPNLKLIEELKRKAGGGDGVRRIQPIQSKSI